MTEVRYPLLFERRLLTKVWGARRLGGLFGIELPAGEAVGESWELSDHPSGESVVVNGPLAGLTLRKLMDDAPREILGNAKAGHGGRFPLLVKFVDSADRLSVQVHPDDAAAERLGEADGGKNESWFVVHADPGAVLWVGLTPGKTRADLESAATKGAFEACLRSLTPRAGDAVAIPAGTIHAIGPGFTLCEVQQTSDVTYRLFDWERPSTPSRPLHREKSFEVARFGARSELTRASIGPATQAPRLEAGELPSPGSFQWRQARSRGTFELPATGSFRIVILLAGALELRATASPAVKVAVEPGQAVLLPAAASGIHGDGEAEFLWVDPT